MSEPPGGSAAVRLDDLQTRHLRTFVAVAEELHFGRAAERLHVSQPAVSRAVSDLEGILGVPLLDRSTRHVELTPAGAGFLADARAALKALGAAGRRAVRAGAATPRLVLALKPDGDGGLLEPALARFEREAPGTEVEFAFAAGGQAELVRDGSADLALLPTPFDATGLDRENVLSEPRLAVLPAGHLLAPLAELPLARALAEPVITWPDAEPAVESIYMGRDPESLAAFTAAPPPRPGPPARELVECLRLVELGRGIAFLPASVCARYQRDSLAYRPVGGLSPLRLQVAWQADARSPLVAALVRCVCDAAASMRGAHGAIPSGSFTSEGTGALLGG